MGKIKPGAPLVKLSLSVILVVLLAVTTIHAKKKGKEVSEVSAEYLSNIGMLGRGYDLLHGDPISAPDPGYRMAVVKIDYQNEEMSADRKWMVPDNTDFTSREACSADSKAQSYSGASSYKSSMNTMVSVSGGFSIGIAAASFSASTGFKKAYDEARTKQTTHVRVEVGCSIYSAALKPSLKWGLDKGFVAAVKELPESIEGNYEPYLDFIRSYGTHFTTKIEMGARSFKDMEYSKEEVAKAESEGVDIAVSAEVSVMGFSVGAGASTSKNTATKDSSSKMDKSAKQSNLGPPFPYKGGSKDESQNIDFTKWFATVSNSPAVVKMELEDIRYLFTKKYFPDDAHIKAKKELLAKAQYEFCKKTEFNCVVPPDPRAAKRLKYEPGERVTWTAPAVEYQAWFKLGSNPILKYSHSDEPITLHGEIKSTRVEDDAPRPEKFAFISHVNRFCITSTEAYTAAMQPCSDITKIGFQQKFTMSKETIVNSFKKCMDIKNNNRNKGAEIMFYDCNGQDNQKWYIDGNRLKSRLNNMCVDLSGGNKKAGGTIITWDCTNGENQRWDKTEIQTPSSKDIMDIEVKTVTGKLKDKQIESFHTSYFVANLNFDKARVEKKKLQARQLVSFRNHDLIKLKYFFHNPSLCTDRPRMLTLIGEVCHNDGTALQVSWRTVINDNVSDECQADKKVYKLPSPECKYVSPIKNPKSKCITESLDGQAGGKVITCVRGFDKLPILVHKMEGVELIVDKKTEEPKEGEMLPDDFMPVVMPAHAYSEKGCYKDSGSNKFLGHFLGKFYTAKTCYGIAAVRGFKYFALRAGGECYADNTLDSKHKPVDKAKCKKACVAESTDGNCGDDKTNLVYSIKRSSVHSGKKNSWEYVGCFLDNENHEDFTNKLGKKESPMSCYKLAKEAKYKYFGLQSGGECWASNNSGRKFGSGTKCDMSCSTSESHICGGSLHNSVYKIHAPSESESSTEED